MAATLQATETLTRLTFDAAIFARAWLSVALASGNDKDGPPELFRTVAVEEFADGVRLVATDRYVILWCWVPTAESDLAEAPALEVAPERTVIAADLHGRTKGFLAHLLKQAAADEDEAKQTIVAVTLGAVEEDGPQGVLDGLDREQVVLDYPGHEQVRMPVVQGTWPSWRALDATFTPRKTVDVALNPEIVGRLAKLGKFNTGPLHWHFGGVNRAARVEIGDVVQVRGLVMPVRVGEDEPEAGL